MQLRYVVEPHTLVVICVYSPIYQGCSTLNFVLARLSCGRDNLSIHISITSIVDFVVFLCCVCVTVFANML